ncbi:MAG: hypothetical protein QXT79_06980 [Thermofilaceae archaeon]
MDLRLQPSAFICSSTGKTAVLIPHRLKVKEGEDYTREIVISWRCSEAGSCPSKTCHYAALSRVLKVRV